MMRALQKVILIAIILLSMELAYSTLTLGHEWGDDWAWYVLQAKSLIQHNTDVLVETGIFITTQSTRHDFGPIIYPWGYPIILVPFYLLRGVHPIVLKIPGMLFFAGFLICLYFWMKTRLTRTESLIIVSMFAFNPMLIKFQDHILSDIPFLFFSTLTLFLFAQNEWPKHFRSIWMGLSVFFTAFLRTTGVLLLGSYLIVEFLDLWKFRGDRQAMRQIITEMIVVCIAFALPFGIALLLLPGGGESYLAQYSTASLQTVRNFSLMYFNVFSEFFGKAREHMYLYYFVFGLFLVGVWKAMKEDTVFIIFSILWMMVHVTYPFWQGARYVFPLLPIFVYFAFQGGNAIVGNLKRWQGLGKYIFHLFWVMIVVMLLYTSATQAYDNMERERRIGGPFDPFTKQVYDFVTKKTSPDSVIVFFKPRVMTLMTGHKSIMSMECERMLIGDYVVVSKKDGNNQQIPREQFIQCNLLAHKVFENLRFIIYKIDG